MILIISIVSTILIRITESFYTLKHLIFYSFFIWFVMRYYAVFCQQLILYHFYGFSVVFVCKSFDSLFSLQFYSMMWRQTGETEYEMMPVHKFSLKWILKSFFNSKTNGTLHKWYDASYHFSVLGVSLSRSLCSVATRRKLLVIENLWPHNIFRFSGECINKRFVCFHVNFFFSLSPVCHECILLTIAIVESIRENYCYLIDCL